MKKRIIYTQFIFRITFLSIITFVSCSNSSEPDSGKKLIIENGFYKAINQTNSADIKCAIEFEYYVKGEECKVGGYGIKYNSVDGGSVNWYTMQTLKPNWRYSIRDTIKLPMQISVYPSISIVMQGYRISSVDIFPDLKAEYTLQSK